VVRRQRGPDVFVLFVICNDIREEMRRGFNETQAMIKFSHVEIDRRVRTLEEAVADLQSRVDRLEDSTH
jgi:uncharacterized protein YceH (UPF0502 family)